MNARHLGDVMVIGAGPAGLCAALAAGELSAGVALLDESRTPGGQLTRQIHRFFGSEHHMAGRRGLDIGPALVERCERHGVAIHCDHKAWGLFPGLTVGVTTGAETFLATARAIVVAAGARERAYPFLGWTLPGVMGAGAAQTVVNVWRVRPGRRAVVVGAGNVGLIVSYQLAQAGIEVACVVEGTASVSGYGVHAARVRRLGIPILTGTTIAEAAGGDRVERVLLEPSGEWVTCDLVCLAVGLRPQPELCQMAGCELQYGERAGWHVPVRDERMATSVPGLFVAGDVCGIEEASTAMEEGYIAGTAAAAFALERPTAEVSARLRASEARVAELRDERGAEAGVADMGA